MFLLSFAAIEFLDPDVGLALSLLFAGGFLLSFFFVVVVVVVWRKPGLETEIGRANVGFVVFEAGLAFVVDVNVGRGRREEWGWLRRGGFE